jgi:threonine dehydratase
VRGLRRGGAAREGAWRDGPGALHLAVQPSRRDRRRRDGLEDWPEADVIVVPIGGGGLVSGIAIAAAARGTTAVAGVEVEASDPFTRSLAAGRIVAIDVRPTLADGLAGNLDPDAVTFEIVRQLVETIVVVGDDALRQGIAGALARERLVVEGAGAAAIGAVLSGALDLRGRRVAVVVSGGNIDDEKLKTIIG